MRRPDELLEFVALSKQLEELIAEECTLLNLPNLLSAEQLILYKDWLLYMQFYHNPNQVQIIDQDALADKVAKCHQLCDQAGVWKLVEKYWY